MARQVRSLKTREEVVAYTNLVTAIINLLVGIWTVASKVMEDPTPPRDTQNQGSYPKWTQGRRKWWPWQGRLRRCCAALAALALDTRLARLKQGVRVLFGPGRFGRRCR